MNLLMIIFGLIGILAAVGTVQAVKERNVISVLFNFAAFVVFGGFKLLDVKGEIKLPMTKITLIEDVTMTLMALVMLTFGL